MQMVLVMLAAASLGIHARDARAQQPKSPVKPLPVAAPVKAPPPTAAKTTSPRKYPVVITTPSLEVQLSAAPAAPLPFKPLALTTPSLEIQLTASPGAAAVPPFKPRSIKTDSVTIILTHP